MEYLKVRWRHGDADDPVLLFSELDEERWETRKVEVFADGRCGYASGGERTEATRLGDAPVPTVPDIAADQQFEPVTITRDEFEEVWTSRHDLRRDLV